MADVRECEAEDPIEWLISLSTTLEEHYEAYRDSNRFSPIQRKVILNMINEYENQMRQILSEVNLKQIRKEQAMKIRKKLLQLSKSAPHKFREELYSIIEQLKS